MFATVGSKLLACVLLLLCSSARGGACRRVGTDKWAPLGVTSNFVLHRGKVIFTQADNSLTALDIETGQVRARLTDRKYSGRLTLAPEGLLISQYGRFLLLDPDSLEVVRERDGIRWRHGIQQVQYTEGLVIYGDRQDRFVCEELSTGRKRWSFDYSYPVAIVARAGAVLFYCGCYRGYGERPVILVDLRSGRDRFRMKPDPGRHYISAHLQEDRVLILEGPHPPGYPDTVVDKIYEVDLSGNMLAEHEAPEGLRGRKGTALWLPLARGIPLNGRLVRINGAEDTPVWDGLHGLYGYFAYPQHGPDYSYDWGCIHAQGAFRVSRGWVTAYLVRSGQSSSDSFPSSSTLINAEIGETHWWGWLPVARFNEDALCSAALFDERLVLGTRHGQVACLDAETGSQHWLYQFPAMKSAFSWRSLSPGDDLDEHAKIYWGLNANPMRSLGVRGLPDDFRPGSEEALRHMEAALRWATPPAKVTTDPQSGRILAYFVRWIALAWAAAIVPLVVCIVIERPRWRRYLGGADVVTWIEFLLLFLTMIAWTWLGRVATGPLWIMPGIVVVGWPILFVRSLILIARRQYLLPLITILLLLGTVVPVALIAMEMTR